MAFIMNNDYSIQTYKNELFNANFLISSFFRMIKIGMKRIGMKRIGMMIGIMMIR